MKRKFIVYAAKNKRKSIKYFGDSLDKLWVSMSDSDQFAVGYAMGFINSDGRIIENLSNDDLESYARRGCNQIDQGNAEPEYEDEEWYEDEADFDKVFEYLKVQQVFDYLKAQRDRDNADSVNSSAEIMASDGYRIDNDWLLKPGNQWYAVAEYWDYGDVESGPIVDSDWAIYQAPSADDAIALAKKESRGEVAIGDARLATPDEIEEYYYILSQDDIY